MNKAASAKTKVTFNKLANQMPKLLKRLKAEPVRTRGNLKGIPEKGVYVFYEKGKLFMLGDLTDLRRGSLSMLKGEAHPIALHLPSISLEGSENLIRRVPTG